jgi:hypothetical protein
VILAGLASWLDAASWTWGLLLGLALFVLSSAVSLLAVTLVLVLLPPSHFRGPAPAARGRAGVARWAGLALKNALGLVLIALGLVLSLPAVPGQGVLTILIGLMLLDFPGRRRLERALLRRPGVLPSINRLRRRFGRPPIEID